MLNNKYINKKSILAVLLGLTILSSLIGAKIFNEFNNVNNKIIEYYNDKERPARSWYDWGVVEDGAALDIVRTKSSILNPIYTVVYSNGDRQGVHYKNDSKYSANADVITFKWTPYLSLVPYDLTASIYRGTKSYNDVVNLAKTTVIPEINKDKNMDDSTYDNSVETFKNPTKEKWLADIEGEKWSVIKELKNPSGTEAIVYSRKNNKQNESFKLKRNDKDLYSEYNISFFDFYPEKEEFTYWLSDDEFIFLVAKGKSENALTDEEKEYYAKYPDGIYKFNIKTENQTMFIPIILVKGEYTRGYLLKDNKLTIVTSQWVYEYELDGKLVSTSTYTEYPVEKLMVK